MFLDLSLIGRVLAGEIRWGRLVAGGKHRRVISSSLIMLLVEAVFSLFLSFFLLFLF